ncbi:MAG: restriction endonuclease subunit S, partial [Bacteroidota bacterium]
MKSNYKALATYIEPVNQLNDGMEVKELLGISNQKFFQNSHTNTIDIDLQTYRIVRTNQFAYNRSTTRNGDKISIALRQGNDCIVSPSYRIFRSKDENELNSEYLMMWFRRPEFDRYARFKSHGSAHEFFEYDQMCQVELPIPSIDKQREIVKEYNVIQNRIILNQQLIQKLEETAQAIYRAWFVEFEFPDEKGKPYKSNGGEMVW